MGHRICPACGTPQQWELWQYCACGHDFGPSEREEIKKPVEKSEASAATERRSAIEGMSREQVIRSIRMRIAGSWGALMIGIAFSFGIVGVLKWVPEWLAALLLWPFLAIAIRLRSMAPALPSLTLGGAIVICGSAVSIAIASIYLPPESADYFVPAAFALGISAVLIPDLLAFRKPLRLVSEEDHKRLQPA